MVLMELHKEIYFMGMYGPSFIRLHRNMGRRSVGTYNLFLTVPKTHAKHTGLLLGNFTYIA